MSKLPAFRRGRSLGAKISGEGVVTWAYFFGFYKTRHILLSDFNATLVAGIKICCFAVNYIFILMIKQYHEIYTYLANTWYLITNSLPITSSRHGVMGLVRFLWPPYEIGHAIIFCRVFYLSVFLFFSSLFSAVGDWMSTILLHSVALVRIQNVRLKCAARGSLEIKHAKMTQKSPSGHHRTNLSGYIFANTACIDNRKKVIKQQYLL